MRPGLFEPRPLSAPCSTAHGAWVLRPLGHMGKFKKISVNQKKTTTIARCAEKRKILINLSLTAWRCKRQRRRQDETAESTCCHVTRVTATVTPEHLSLRHNACIPLTDNTLPHTISNNVGGSAYLWMTASNHHLTNISNTFSNWSG